MQTTADGQTLNKSLGKSELVPLSHNLVDIVWGSERPRRPKNLVFPLDVKYSGLNISSPLSSLFLDLLQGKVSAVKSIVQDMNWLRRTRLRWPSLCSTRLHGYSIYVERTSSLTPVGISSFSLDEWLKRCSVFCICGRETRHGRVVRRRDAGG